MAATGHIRLLSAEVANKIAAGEVVERPAAVLKELIENAIDAGATTIKVVIVAGGTRLISVTDDGCGMGRDDALLAIERHATSKIREVEDIEHIGTLGFRGEALAATASVSRFRLQTAPRDGSGGTEIQVSGGRIQDVRDIGSPAGTVIEVRDLFFNVPARRKFLRSEQTELAHLRQTFLVHALAHPTLAMELKVDGREIYRLAGGATLDQRIRELFDAGFRRQLLPVEYAAGTVQVTGYVGQPALSRSDTVEQFIFVNNRPVTVPLVGRAIREGYHSLLPGERHPAVFLFIAIDPGLVDVNVHPTKKEVRFRNAHEVRDAVAAAIRQALTNKSSAADQKPAEEISGVAPFPADGVQAGQFEQGRLLHIENLPPIRAFRFPGLPMVPSGTPPTVSSDQHVAPLDGQPAPESISAGGSGPVVASSTIGSDTNNSPWKWCRVVGQVGGLYVILETEDGYVVMDPHAAHERVMFERYMRSYASGQCTTQGLLVPETVELMPQDAQRVRRNIDLLRKMGFGIAEFGSDTFVVDALPSQFAAAQVRILLADIAQRLDDIGSRGVQEAGREEAIAMAACKASVRARDNLSLAEIEELVVALASTAMPYTCPHGRPTLIYTSFKDLHREFGR